MDLFDNDYYKWNKLLLSLTGLWPYQTVKNRFFPYTIMVLGITSLCIPQIINIFKNCSEVDELYSALPMTFGSVIAFMKVVIASFSQTKMKVLLGEIRKDWMNYLDTEEFDILKKHAGNSRKMTISYGTLVVFPAFFYILWPLCVPILDIIIPLNESRPRYLVHPAEYFIDQDKYYYLIVFDEFFGYIIGITVTSGMDTSYFLFVEHVCGMFVVLCHRLKNIQIENLRNSKRTDVTVHLQVIDCIKLHLKIRQFSKFVISVYTVYLLFDIGPGLLMHSTLSVLNIFVCTYIKTVIKIVLNLGNADRLGRFIVILTAQSFRLLLNSWPGQRLIDHSLQIHDAAYDAPWYNLSVRARKMLTFLIMESQEPHTINFANLYIVNMDSFGTVIKTSISYCTVMASLHDGT